MTAGHRLGFAALATLSAAASAAWPALAGIANRHWYAGLLKPFFAPSAPVAGLLLVVVAAAAGRALFRVLCRPDYHPDRVPAARAILAALAGCGLWTWAFFIGRHPTLSLVLAAVAVAAAVSAMRRVGAVDGRAALLLLPWTLGIALAGLVNLSIHLRNG